MPLAFRPMPGAIICAHYPRLGQERDVPQRDETTDTSITRVRMLRGESLH